MKPGSSGGRPRDAAIDTALIDAATQLISEKGFGAVTVDEVARRAGTTTPAFYRRFSQVADMVPGIIQRRHGDVPPIDSGSLEGDLLALQRFQADIFNDVFVRRSMAGWLSHLATRPEQARGFVEGFLGNRLVLLQGMLDRSRDRGESLWTVPAAQVMDILVGPLLMRSLMPDLGAADEQVQRDTVHTSLCVLGVRTPASD